MKPSTRWPTWGDTCVEVHEMAPPLKPPTNHERNFLNQWRSEMDYDCFCHHWHLIFPPSIRIRAICFFGPVGNNRAIKLLQWFWITTWPEWLPKYWHQDIVFSLSIELYLQYQSLCRPYSLPGFLWGVERIFKRMRKNERKLAADRLWWLDECFY